MPGVARFYYTQDLPARATAIAAVSTTPATPSEMTDVNNTVYLPASLGIWKSSTPDASPADFTAPDYNQSITISGSTVYRLNNPFFEITSQYDASSNPLYYSHSLPAGVQSAQVVDLDGNAVSGPSLLSEGVFYHTMDGGAYRLTYVDASGYPVSTLLMYTPVLIPNLYQAGPAAYQLTGRTLTLSSNGNFSIRFLAQAGYLATAPYTVQPNTPWYARLRYSLSAVPPEYARQIFSPIRPYQLASWVPGKVLGPNLIEFERKQIFSDGLHMPDILVFDAEHNFKFALDGTAAGEPRRRGSIYTWKRNQIQALDTYMGRAQVLVPLDPTDIVYGFYSYRELDVVYRAIDLNPFTNPTVLNRVVQFYFKSNGSDNLHFLYYQVVDPVTGPITGLTNDPSPTTGTNTVFAEVLVGARYSPSRFTVTDIRTRGGGLKPQYQTIPEAASCWDLGYLDGKPYPLGGVLAVYIPASALNTLTRSAILTRINRCLPAGSLPVLRFYNPDGSELI